MELLNQRYEHREHIGKLLGIEFTEFGEDFIVGKMPVDGRTHQPYGILHGGASVVLAETLGSVASDFCIDETKLAVGVEVNANHLRSVKTGYVTAICKAVHVGGKMHVWDIRIFDDQKKAVCISRLTTAIVSKESHLV